MNKDRSFVNKDLSAMVPDRSFVNKDLPFVNKDRSFVNQDLTFVDKDLLIIEFAQQRRSWFSMGERFDWFEM